MLKVRSFLLQTLLRKPVYTVSPFFWHFWHFWPIIFSAFSSFSNFFWGCWLRNWATRIDTAQIQEPCRGLGSWHVKYPWLALRNEWPSRRAGEPLTSLRSLQSVSLVSLFVTRMCFTITVEVFCQISLNVSVGCQLRMDIQVDTKVDRLTSLGKGNFEKLEYFISRNFNFDTLSYGLRHHRLCAGVHLVQFS